MASPEHDENSVTPAKHLVRCEFYMMIYGQAHAKTADFSEFAQGTFTHVYAHNDGQSKSAGVDKQESLLPDGVKVTSFASGNVKETYPNGYTVIRFVNGDAKTVSCILLRHGIDNRFCRMGRGCINTHSLKSRKRHTLMGLFYLIFQTVKQRSATRMAQLKLFFQTRLSAIFLPLARQVHLADY
jgi:hypothetical protein